MACPVMLTEPMLKKIGDRYRHFATEPRTVLVDASARPEAVTAHLVQVIDRA